MRRRDLVRLRDLVRGRDLVRLRDLVRRAPPLLVGMRREVNFLGDNILCLRKLVIILYTPKKN